MSIGPNAEIRLKSRPYLKVDLVVVFERDGLIKQPLQSSLLVDNILAHKLNHQRKCLSGKLYPRAHILCLRSTGVDGVAKPFVFQESLVFFLDF